ncbi:hypothetical protein ZP13_24775 [Salmonella enterica subsp. enterica]|nr:hypothetical protein [Salmonella enterica]ECC3607905.1 hypothetical protein [Salmonella enterica subsp. enterica]ECE0941371.1 hypothetical protein [Salmonella enterica subsp. enterica]ECH9421179.1 hypothetical protein [Salmonella enterica subsp. enterica]ECI2262683.1 hypothetical protein [Salmonella enterica subsp. enterica]
MQHETWAATIATITIALASAAHAANWTSAKGFIFAGNGTPNGAGSIYVGDRGIIRLNQNASVTCALEFDHIAVPTCPFKSDVAESYTAQLNLTISLVSSRGTIQTIPASATTNIATNAVFHPTYDHLEGTVNKTWVSNRTAWDLWINVAPPPTIINHPETIVDSVKLYIYAGLPAGAGTVHGNPYQRIFSYDDTISYKIINGVIMRPTEPEVSCSASAESIRLEHGNIKPSASATDQRTQQFSIACDNDATVRVSLSGTTNGQLDKVISMNGIDTHLAMTEDSGTSWFANQELKVTKGTKPIMIRSVLSDQSKPGDYTGHDIITITYQ